MKELFGKELSWEEAEASIRRDRRKKTGYAAPPGTGPAGEFCRTCNHACYHTCSKRYYKCALVKSTAGPGTDIRLKSPACKRWQAIAKPAPSPAAPPASP